MNGDRIANALNWAKAHTTAVALTCIVTVSLGLYLLTQHTAHVVGALPYALILLCPLMHFFMPGMHGGHGGHGGHEGHEGHGGGAGYDGRGDHTDHTGHTDHTDHAGLGGPEGRPSVHSHEDSPQSPPPGR